MKLISKLRFDSLAGYSRTPYFRFMAHEIDWFEESGEKVLGMLILDLTDHDYACMVLGRDKKRRFRAVKVDANFSTVWDAYEALKARLAEYAKMPPEEFYQGDEVGEPPDFFTPAVPTDRLHPRFNFLIASRGATPARELLTEMMYYFEDVDGNFVKDFQTNGFDARLWELYLYGVFTELGYSLNRDHKVPDFHCQGPLGDFFIEATTVNPSDELPEIDDTTRQSYFEHYVPIKFGSALFSKLKKRTEGKKRYWELPHVEDHPFLLAIQDFHEPQSMSWSGAALAEYLYGIRQIGKKRSDNSLEIVAEHVEKYIWEQKKIPSGFFLQPDAENISAVLANPSGTFSKFNRLGFLAGFGDRDIRMTRKGLCYRDSDSPEEFTDEVHAADYFETWCEGLSVYHNPRAKHPLPESALPDAAHYYSREGQIMARHPEFHPAGSVTFIKTPKK